MAHSPAPMLSQLALPESEWPGAGAAVVVVTLRFFGFGVAATRVRRRDVVGVVASARSSTGAAVVDVDEVEELVLGCVGFVVVVGGTEDEAGIANGTTNTAPHMMKKKTTRKARL